jgi:hypothetical protein
MSHCMQQPSGGDTSSRGVDVRTATPRPRGVGGIANAARRGALGRRAARRGLALVVAVALLAPALASAQQTVRPSHVEQLQANSNALGLTIGYPGMTGFAYRRYIGDTFVQANLLPLVADQGNFLAIMLGLTVGHYLVMWEQPSTVSLLPSTSALRVVGGVSTFFSRDASFGDAIAAPACTGPNCTTTPTQTKASIENTTGLGAGIGFEFGAIRKHGFSFSLDLMLTATWDDVGFNWLVPLPYGAIMYSW